MWLRTAWREATQGSTASQQTAMAPAAAAKRSQPLTRDRSPPAAGVECSAVVVRHWDRPRSGTARTPEKYEAATRPSIRSVDVDRLSVAAYRFNTSAACGNTFSNISQAISSVRQRFRV